MDITVERQSTTHRWTREQYEQMVEAGVFGEDDRVELINGAIVTMSPQGSRHATVVGLVSDALQKFYETGGVIRVQMPLALGAISEPEPDVAVVAGERRDFLGAHPDTATLVVEVSETSVTLDRTQKKELYAQHGIEEYWIVDLDDEALEVYRDPAGAKYETKRTFHRGESVRPPQSTGPVPVADLLP